MLSQSSLSVVTQIQDRNPGITKEDRDRLLPTISSLSDLMWLAWNTVSSSPKELRYIARDTIFNEDSLAVMDYLFLRDKKDNRAVPWPGLEYKGDSDEGKALLATPNGRSTAWLLIDHAQEMRWKGEITQRQLKVNIFSVAGDYCMLWDMEPQSPRKRSWLGDKLRRHVGRYLRGSIYNKRKVGLAYNETSAQSSYPAHVKHHNKPTLPKPQAFNDSLVKRDPAAEFETAKCTGQRMWAKIQSAFDGHGDPVQSFLPSALNNGWTRGDEKMALDSTWRRYFDRQLGQGKVPPADQVSFVRLVQDRDFVNSQGKSVKVSRCKSQKPIP